MFKQRENNKIKLNQTVVEEGGLNKTIAQYFLHMCIDFKIFISVSDDLTLVYIWCKIYILLYTF